MFMTTTKSPLDVETSEPSEGGRLRRGRRRAPEPGFARQRRMWRTATRSRSWASSPRRSNCASAPTVRTCWPFGLSCGRRRRHRVVVRCPRGTAANVTCSTCVAVLATLRRRLESYRCGDVLDLSGSLRHRFWNSGGRVQSRYEIEVTTGQGGWLAVRSWLRRWTGPSRDAQL